MTTASAPLSTGDTASGSELTVATLESKLLPVATEWDKLGRKLGLQEWRLNIIAADIPPGLGASARRLSAVLHEWLKSVTDGSWSHIVSALREMDENILAREMEMECCRPAQGLSQPVSQETQQERSEEAIALLHENMMTMKDRFAQLQIFVYEKIQERLDMKKIKAKNFRIYMINLFPPGKCIPETTDVSEIFTAITQNGLWDYLNCDTLVRVAKMYGGNNPELMEKLKDYSEALVGYKVVTKMADHLSDIPVMSTSDSEDGDMSSPSPVRTDQHFRRKLMVKLKIPITTQSLTYVDEIWNSLAKKFLLPSSSAILDEIIKGSLYITWLIPAVFVPQVMEIAEQPEMSEFFRKKRIQMITVDGACLYEEQEVSLLAWLGQHSHDDSHEREEFSATVKVKSVDNDDDEPSPHPLSHFEPHPPPQPRITGYDVELVAESPNLSCPICLFVLRDPVQVNCCGKRFCAQCIEPIISRGKPCPACKHKAGEYIVFRDKGLKKEISEVRIYCSNSNKGCGWRGELCQLDNHLNFNPEEGKTGIGCQYVELKCIFCSEDCQRRHMRSCPQKLYTCPYCKHYSSTYDELNNNHLSECMKFPVQCKVCSMKIPRKSLQHHHLECEYPSHQSTAIPLKLTTVETPSPVFIPPPNFLMMDFTNYKESGVTWYSPPFYSHIGGYKMCLEVDANGYGSGAGTHVSVCVCLMCGEYDDNLPWPFRAEVTFQLVNQKRDEGHVEKTVPFDDSASEECTGRVAEGEIAPGMGSFKFIHHSALSYDKSWNTEFLMSEDDSLEFHLQSVKLSKTAKGLPAMASNQPSSDAITAEQPELPPIPPVNIVMGNFISHKLHADSWYSPAFYSHIGGYKMCLRVDANGQGSAEGTHVSVRVHLMQGQHDSHLAWPFCGVITFHLVNQEMDSGHVEKIVPFDDSTPDSCAGRVTEGERAQTGGGCDIIPHSALHYDASRNTEFLKKDTLIFQVTQIQLTSSMGLQAEACDQQSRDTEQPVSDRSSHDIISASRELGESVQARSIEETHYSTAQGLSHSDELVMKDHFTQLQAVVCRKIENRLNTKEIKRENFTVYMTTLFPSLECISKTIDVSKIFTAITQNSLWDYLNYLPLERVANMFGGKDPDLKAKLKAYTQELNDFKARTKMVSIVTITGDQSPTLAKNDKQYHSELTVKFKFPTTAQSLLYVDKVYKSLSRRFLLPPSSAILDKTTEGPVLMTWLIPAFFVPQMMEMAEQPEIIELFREMKAEMASVDGACLYGEQEEESSLGLNEAAAVKLAGYDVELVKESADLRCLICLLVLLDPIQVDCCGRRFCRTCIEAVIAESKPCPACKCKPGEYDIFDDKGQKQAILEAKVRCPNRKAGCSWKGELYELDNHLNLDPEKGRKIDIGCPYAVVKCIHCSEDCQRHHMPGCPQQPYTCPYCKLYSSTYEDVSSHLPECEEFPVQCKVCSMKISRKALQHHHLECDRNKDPSHQDIAIALTVETPSPVFVPPPNIIMTEFTALKESGVTWYSTPFYSHIGGYKMRLRVDANGVVGGEGTHVTVGVCLMHGEYDDHLIWPFRGHVTYQLVNQRSDERHVERTVTFDVSDPEYTGQVAEGEKTPGMGHIKFISHSALHYDKSRNTEFLKSDTLVFQVTQIKLITQN